MIKHFCELIQDCKIFDKKVFFDFATQDILSWAFGRGHIYYLRLDYKLYIMIDDDNKKMYLRDGELTFNEFNDIIASKVYNNYYII